MLAGVRWVLSNLLPRQLPAHAGAGLAGCPKPYRAVMGHGGLRRVTAGYGGLQLHRQAKSGISSQSHIAARRIQIYNRVAMQARVRYPAAVRLPTGGGLRRATRGPMAGYGGP
jgi:hypothetical protein